MEPDEATASLLTSDYDAHPDSACAYCLRRVRQGVDGPLHRYGEAVRQAPCLMGAVTLGLLAAAGDVTAQAIEQRHAREPTFDQTRFIALVAYAAIYNGPVNSRLYHVYAYLFGDGSLSTALKSTALDQLLYMPLGAIPVSFFFKDTITHGDVDLVRWRAYLMARWWDAVMGCWMIWVPCELVNLYFVPLRYRLAFSGAICFTWMVALSMVQSTGLAR